MIVRMKKMLALCLCFSFITSTLYSDEGNVVTKVGKEVVDATTDVGKVVGKGAKKVSGVGVDAGKAVGQGAKKVGEEAVDLVKKAKELFYDPIVVSATRLPSVKTRLSDAPANASVITRETIDGTGADTIQEALQYIEGVNLYDAVGNGVDTSFNLRGFTNNEELAVIVDGVRVNETDLNVFNPNLLNLDTLETIELMRGSSSTLYGDSVFGGVLNITTKQPSEKLFSPFGSYEVGSHRKQNYTAGASGTVQDKYFLGIPGQVKYLFSASRRLDNGFRENGDTRGTWFDGKLGYQLEDETGEVMFNIKYTDQENHNPGELTMAEYSADRTQTAKPLDNRKWENLVLSVNANKSILEEHLDFSVNAYRRLNDIDFVSSYRSGTTEEFFTLSTQKGIVSQVTYNEELGEFKNQLVAGVEYLNASDNNEKIVLAGGGSAADNSLDKDNTGFFAQDTLTIYDKLVLQFGMRHDEVDFRFEDHNNGANNGVSGFDETTVRAGVVVKPIENIDFYGNVSEAFKAPGSSEMFNTTGWGGNDPGLKPEEALSFEFGTRVRWEDKVSLKLGYFHIDTDEEIQSIETAPWTYVNQNIGKTRRYGIEAAVNIRPVDLVDAYFTYTYTNATVRKTTTYVESGRELGLVPQNRFTAGVHVGPVKGCNLWLNALYVGRQQAQSYETLSHSTSPIESYFVLNGKISYEYKGAEIYMLANNLLDREYTTRSIYGWGGGTLYVMPAPRREIVAGVKFEF